MSVTDVMHRRFGWNGAGYREYLAAFQNRILPALDKFEPEFILISGREGWSPQPVLEIFLMRELAPGHHAFIKSSR